MQVHLRLSCSLDSTMTNNKQNRVYVTLPSTKTRLQMERVYRAVVSLPPSVSGLFNKQDSQIFIVFQQLNPQLYFFKPMLKRKRSHFSFSIANHLSVLLFSIGLRWGNDVQHK